MRPTASSVERSEITPSLESWTNRYTVPAVITPTKAKAAPSQRRMPIHGLGRSDTLGWRILRAIPETLGWRILRAI